MERIDDVVAALDRIIGIEHQHGSRRGYFACMYRATTLRVARALRDGRFTDPALMERLDVAFAHYYLDAWRRDSIARPCSGPWRVAFQATRDPDLLILQHLLLGMNAHINLDLALSTVDVAEDRLDDLRADFDAINDILGEQLDEVQDVLNAHSSTLCDLDEAGGRWDERLFHFSVSRARDASWAEARVLASLPDDARPTARLVLETQAAAFGRLIGGVRVAEARGCEPDVDRAGVREVIDTLWALG